MVAVKIILMYVMPFGLVEVNRVLGGIECFHLPGKVGFPTMGMTVVISLERSVNLEDGCVDGHNKPPLDHILSQLKARTSPPSRHSF
jgi:hypothetical protein